MLECSIFYKVKINFFKKLICELKSNRLNVKNKIFNFNLLLLFLIDIQIGRSYITFDSGGPLTIREAFPCNGYFLDIQFGGIFRRIPQIILTPNYIEAGDPVSFSLYTTFVGTEKFSLSLYCLIGPLTLRWVAIDDSRIETFYLQETIRFDGKVPAQADRLITQDHSNINALQGFVSVISINTPLLVSFSVDIQSITADKVTMRINEISDQNFYIAIRFYLVLGTSEAFSMTNRIKETLLSTSNIFDSGIIPLQPGYKLFVPFEGIQKISAGNLGVALTQTETDTTSQYQRWSFYGTIDSMSWREVLFNSQNAKILYPMLYQKMRISRGIYRNQDSHQVFLEISELSEAYSDVISKSVLIPKPIQTLHMVVTLKCTSGNKVSGFILKSFQGSKQNVDQNCYGGMNQLILYIAFYQIDNVNQQLSLDVTTSGVFITQSVLNQFGSTSYNIMKIDIVSQ